MERVSVSCTFCGALHWIHERVSNSSMTAPKFETCCKRGDVKLDMLRQPPPYMQHLLTSSETLARTYRNRIREYNSALAFTSVKYQPDNRSELQDTGFRCFQIHRELYHLQGPLRPSENASPAFAQLYFYDPTYAAHERHTAHPQLDSSILLQLTTALHEVNPYIQIYKTARERLEMIASDETAARVVLNPQLRLIVETGADRRRENLPTSNEIALIIPDEYGEAGFRDIVLAKRNGSDNNTFSIINPNHASYMALHYVLLFPHGDLGWHWGLELLDPRQVRKKLRLSQ